MSLASLANPLASPAAQLRILNGPRLRKTFAESLAESGLAPLTATGIRVFQINVGKLCNQTCGHCHVDAGPDRREVMMRETAELCVAALRSTGETPRRGRCRVSPRSSRRSPAATPVG